MWPGTVQTMAASVTQNESGKEVVDHVRTLGGLPLDSQAIAALLHPCEKFSGPAACSGGDLKPRAGDLYR